MSALSRLPLDVRWAVTTARLAHDEAQRAHIRDAQPVSRAQMIADICHGLETAEMIQRDVRTCRADRQVHPIRWAIDLMREPDKLSMLAAIVDDVRRLMDDLRTDGGRAVMS